MNRNESRPPKMQDEGVVFSAKEAYRTIRTNLMFSVAKKGCKVIVFSSSIQGEGKTTTSANVAFSVARSNQKVLLIDLDLRNPHIYKLLKKPNAPGMTNYLSGFNTLDEVIHKDAYPNLDVICAGTISPNPAEMVASESVGKLMEEMKTKYDFIIIDTPPLNIVSDALSLVRYADGIVLVVRPKYTAKKEVQKAIDQVNFVGGKILGVIANGVQEKKRGYGRYGRYGYGRYGYGYGREPENMPQVKKKAEKDSETNAE